MAEQEQGVLVSL